MIYPKHTPAIIKPLAKHLCFNIPNDKNEIYLTFDDGPHPEITPWALDQLKNFSAKATFFLIGEKIERHASLVNRILAEGHAIGNHTMNHVSGWKTKDAIYFKQINECNKILKSKLFRPPYGQITYGQSVFLNQKFKIVMWSDLSADFDSEKTEHDCFKYATNKVKSGSVIVFHDSIKAWPRLKKALPRALSYYEEKGFKMSPITI